MWIVKEEFADMTDNGFQYRVGDVFPRSGVEVPETRLRELSSSTNRLGVQLIAKSEPKPKRSRRKPAKEG